MRWRLTVLVAAVAAAVPAGAFAADHRLAVPPWMQRMIGHAPPEMQRIMQTPQVRQMMGNPPPGMEKMMQSPGMLQAVETAPDGMAQMMQSAEKQQMMGGHGH